MQLQLLLLFLHQSEPPSNPIPEPHTLSRQWDSIPVGAAAAVYHRRCGLTVLPRLRSDCQLVALSLHFPLQAEASVSLASSELAREHALKRTHARALPAFATT